MAVRVNLLPENYTAKKGVMLLSSWLKIGTLIVLVIAIFSAVGLLAFFLISSSQLKNLENNISVLEDRVSALSESEQKMVLLRDRLDKVKTLRSNPSADRSLSSIEPIIDLLPSGATLSEVSLDTSKIDASFLFSDTVSLSSFLDTLETSGSFTAITLTSFGFTAQSGYLVGLRLVL